MPANYNLGGFMADENTEAENEATEPAPDDTANKLAALAETANTILEAVTAMREAMDSFVAAGVTINDEEDDEDDEDDEEALEDLEDLDFTIDED